MARRNDDEVAMTAQSFCNMSQRLKFAEGFVKMANDESKAKDVFAFFCYFVAFNVLYGFHRGYDEKEYETIVYFLKNHVYSDGAGFNFHPGESQEFPLLNGKVARGLYEGSQKTMWESSYIHNEEDADIKVFLRIYQVRCNLFHGEKTLNNRRDMPLIRESNKVFQKFFAEYFEWQKDK